MRVLTLLSAFLFACVLLCMAFFGYWSYTTNQIVKKLPEYFSQNLMGNVKYERVVRHWDPLATSLTLKGVSWSYLDAQSGRSIVVELGDIPVKSDLYDFEAVKFSMPQDMLAIFKSNGETSRYRITTTSAMVEIIKTKMEESIFASTNYLLISAEKDGVFKPVSHSAYGYVSRDKQRNWSLSINDLEIKNMGNTAFSKIDTASFNWSMQNVSQHKFPEIVSYFVKQKGALKNKLKIFKDDTFLLDVKDARLSFGKQWYSANGLFGLDEEGYAQVDSYITTNEFDAFLAFVRKTVGGDLPLALDSMMRRIFDGKSSLQGMDVVARKDRLYLNGSPAGEVEPLVK